MASGAFHRGLKRTFKKLFKSKEARHAYLPCPDPSEWMRPAAPLLTSTDADDAPQVCAGRLRRLFGVLLDDGLSGSGLSGKWISFVLLLLIIAFDLLCFYFLSPLLGAFVAYGIWLVSCLLCWAFLSRFGDSCFHFLVSFVGRFCCVWVMFSFRPPGHEIQHPRRVGCE
jgi:hypothetical protein